MARKPVLDAPSLEVAERQKSTTNRVEKSALMRRPRIMHRLRPLACRARGGEKETSRSDQRAAWHRPSIAYVNLLSRALS